MLAPTTLTEIVSIDIDDFSESFLTCSTCLCPFDDERRKPKLLNCSHTVCSTCLEAIADLPQSLDTGSFRCPICRETIPVPRGGVAALPPSFLVNQLIDHMNHRRRDLVPKCTSHQSEELLFCEMCDAVFCPVCTAAEDCQNHTVVPFSTAIKRMSEIMLYKANQCIKTLNKAAENVNLEVEALGENIATATEQLNSSFTQLANLVNERRNELLQLLHKTDESKRKILMEQLAIIRTEKDKIEDECSHIQNQPNIRQITRRINDLNEKLDSSLNLLEPRENSYIVYERGSSKNAIQNAINAVSSFGSLLVSKTFPSLCVAEVQQLTLNTKSSVLLTAMDYDGHYRVTGGDPVEATLYYYGEGEMANRVAAGIEGAARPVPTTVKDNGNGSYTVTFRPDHAGRYCLHISIFKRPIKNSPLCLDVSPHINPVWQYSKSGSGSSSSASSKSIDDSKTCSLLQPVRVSVDATGQIYILDTGHNRVKVLSRDGRLIHQFGGKSLLHHSTVGLALLPTGSGFLTLNWRLKVVTEWSREGHEVKTFSFSEFMEPIDLAVDRAANIFVLDAGASKVFMFDPDAKPLLSFPVGGFTKRSSPSPAPSSNHHLSVDNERTTGKTAHDGTGCQPTAICVGRQNEIVVAGSEVRFFDASGQLLRSHSVDVEQGSPPQLVGGIVVDDEGNLLATVTSKKACYVLVLDHAGRVVNKVDSAEARLRRPTGICVSGNCHCIVADLGNNCIKMYRYK